MKHQIIQISLPLQLYIHKLSNQTQFKLNRINEIKYYFIAKIREREAASKVFSKYIATFDNFNKILFYQYQVVVFPLIPLLLLLACQ